MGSSVCGYTLEPVCLNIARKYSYLIIHISHESSILSESCWDGGEEMFCHHWLSSPFSCSALLDMQSGQLTVTTDVMSLPPPCTWSWLQALHVHSLRCLTKGEHLSKTWESNLPKWGHCSKCDGCVWWSDLLMSVDLTTSHSGYTYCGQNWLTAVLPFPCVPCVGEVIGVWVCVSLVSRCLKENGKDCWYPLFAHAWLPRFF